MQGFLLFHHFEFDEFGFYSSIRSSMQFGQFGDLVAFVKSFQQKSCLLRLSMAVPVFPYGQGPLFN